ncbi:MAG: transcriptional regulator [Crocinitomicaceae bacterium]|nr:transcriptional regulator [Crocinitomicaceae bacterium]|tara:strand:+ start:11275 stop:11718 length:444 start_codon:yes stop_codon:yes gene_type:complete
MKISKTSQYAIRALIYINQKSITSSDPISIKEIAKGINSPEHFTAKLLQPLTKNKILASVKGPGGGFLVNEITGGVTIRTVVEIIEGEDFFSDCFLGLPGCSDEKPCPAHFSYVSLKQQTMELFDGLTINTLTASLESNKDLFSIFG